MTLCPLMGYITSLSLLPLRLLPLHSLLSPLCAFFLEDHVSNNSQLARIALSISRKGAFPSMIVVELCHVCAFFCFLTYIETLKPPLLIWSGLLWILWVAVGATILKLPSDNLSICLLSSCTYGSNFRRILSHNSTVLKLVG